MDPLQAAVLAIPGDVDRKTILKHVGQWINERNARLGAAEEEVQKSKHKLFIDQWCTAYEAKFGSKYAFMGGKDGSAVTKLLSFGFEIEHLMRIAKAAWENPPNTFFCKMAGSIPGFMSRINEIRAELNSIRGKSTKALPPHVQLQILKEMRTSHVCNPNSVEYDESRITPDARKEYADIKRKIMEIEHTQRQRALA